MNLFIFGSLLGQDILNTVLASDYPLDSSPTHTIPNYQAYYVLGEDYPMLLKQRGAYTKGKIITINDRREIDRLIYYEGDENPLVQICNKKNLYAFIADSSLTPSRKIWSYEKWVNTSAHAKLLKRVKRFMLLFDTEGTSNSW